MQNYSYLIFSRNEDCVIIVLRDGRQTKKIYTIAHAIRIILYYFEKKDINWMDAVDMIKELGCRENLPLKSKEWNADEEQKFLYEFAEVVSALNDFFGLAVEYEDENPDNESELNKNKAFTADELKFLLSEKRGQN